MNINVIFEKFVLYDNINRHIWQYTPFYFLITKMVKLYNILIFW